MQKVEEIELSFLDSKQRSYSFSPLSLESPVILQSLCTMSDQLS
jgi:hypothetical protein